MEFQYQHMVAMQDQNPTVYRRLRDSGELDRFARAEWSNINGPNY
ncbi:MAG TPA: hypothetical protein VNO18_13930 [Xanthobacteraceae bacterium]|nr:hypothetical protein [Xanthobacteraceae bacterium]